MVYTSLQLTYELKTRNFSNILFRHPVLIFELLFLDDLTKIQYNTTTNFKFLNEFYFKMLHQNFLETIVDKLWMVYYKPAVDSWNDSLIRNMDLKSRYGLSNDITISG